MTQLEIVYIIIAGVIAYILFMAIKKYRVKKTRPCDSCSGCILKEKVNNIDLHCNVTTK